MYTVEKARKQTQREVSHHVRSEMKSETIMEPDSTARTSSLHRYIRLNKWRNVHEILTEGEEWPIARCSETDINADEQYTKNKDINATISQNLSPILFKSNSIGWTAVHFLMLHGTPSLSWWKWMLLKILEEKQQQEQRSTIPQLEDTHTIDDCSKEFQQCYYTGDMEIDFIQQKPSRLDHKSRSRDHQFKGRKLSVSSCIPAFNTSNTNPFFIRNDLGHSPTDLFFSRRLHPFPWECMPIRRDADRLRVYIQGLICDTHTSCIDDNNGLDSNSNELLDLKIRIKMKYHEEKIRQEADGLVSNLVQVQVNKRDNTLGRDLSHQLPVNGQHNSGGLTSDAVENDQNCERIIAQHELEHEMSHTEHVHEVEEIHDTRGNNNVDSHVPFSHTHSMKSTECLERLANLWHEMELITMAAVYGTFEIKSEDTEGETQNHEKTNPFETSWPILHALSTIGCPSEIAWLAIKLYPDQVYKRDVNGNLPIHIASKSHNTALSEGVWHQGAGVDGSAPSKMSGGTSPMLECLLRVYPEGCLILNLEGQLPIHLAIRAGKMWETGIYDIFRACPSVLIGAVRDTPSQLHSFMLAATRSSDGTESGGKHIPEHHDSDSGDQKKDAIEKWEEIYARRNVSRAIGSMWRYLPSRSKRQYLLSAKASLEKTKLTTIYELLKSMPDAVSARNLN